MNIINKIKSMIKGHKNPVINKAILNNMNFPEKLKLLVEYAGNADSNYCIFGSETHKYTFNQPAEIEDILKFEKKYNIKLPESYISFLTLVGNGGAGPFYGLYSLEQLEHNNEYLMQDNSIETFIDKNLTVEEWNKVVKVYDESDDDSFDAIMCRITKGALVIGTQGCSVDTLLMCGGSEYGKIVYINWDMNCDCPPELTNLTFEEWVISYFYKIVIGDIRKYPNMNVVNMY